MYVTFYLYVFSVITVGPSSPKRDQEQDYREGDKIEARYRGGGRYYPGKIAYDNRNGTYDIDYDDGEKERRVESKLIRRLEGMFFFVLSEFRICALSAYNLEAAFFLVSTSFIIGST